MKTRCYLPLADFINNLYSEAARANTQAQLQQEAYLKAIAAHSQTIPTIGVIDMLAIDTLSMSINFQVVVPPISIIEKITIFFRWTKAYPKGVYLKVTNKQDATLTINLGLSGKDNRRTKTIEPEINYKSNYYVLTTAS